MQLYKVNRKYCKNTITGRKLVEHCISNAKIMGLFPMQVTDILIKRYRLNAQQVAFGKSIC